MQPSTPDSKPLGDASPPPSWREKPFERWRIPTGVSTSLSQQSFANSTSTRLSDKELSSSNVGGAYGVSFDVTSEPSTSYMRLSTRSATTSVIVKQDSLGHLHRSTTICVEESPQVVWSTQSPGQPPEAEVGEERSPMRREGGPPTLAAGPVAHALLRSGSFPSMTSLSQSGGSLVATRSPKQRIPVHRPPLTPSREPLPPGSPSAPQVLTPMSSGNRSFLRRRTISDDDRLSTFEPTVATHSNDCSSSISANEIVVMAPQRTSHCGVSPLRGSRTSPRDDAPNAFVHTFTTSGENPLTADFGSTSDEETDDGSSDESLTSCCVIPGLSGSEEARGQHLASDPEVDLHPSSFARRSGQPGGKYASGRRGFSIDCPLQPDDSVRED